MKSRGLHHQRCGKANGSFIAGEFSLTRERCPPRFLTQIEEKNGSHWQRRL
jgi:hypothetical protein